MKQVYLLSHTRERRRAEQSGGKASGEEAPKKSFSCRGIAARFRPRAACAQARRDGEMAGGREGGRNRGRSGGVGRC